MSFTRSNLKSSINSRIHNKIGMIADINTLINDQVREAWKVDMRSGKREATLSPNLDEDVYEYTCPTDLKGFKIIDLRPTTADRNSWQTWNFVSDEEFSRRKLNEANILTIKDRDMVRVLQISDYAIDDSDATAKLVYYSKYPWRNSAGTWQLQSTADSDLLNVDEDEYSMVLEKCVEAAAYETREEEDAKTAKNNYKERLKEYQRVYKSEAIASQTTIYNF